MKEPHHPDVNWHGNRFRPRFSGKAFVVGKRGKEFLMPPTSGVFVAAIDRINETQNLLKKIVDILETMK